MLILCVRGPDLARKIRPISLLSFSLLVGSLSLGGCTSSPSVASTSLALSRSSNTLSIRSHPDYKRAELLFHSGKKAESRALLAGLKKSSTSLSPQDTEFLDRQIDITASSDLPVSQSSPTLRLTVRTSLAKGLSGGGMAYSADCGPRALKIACDALGLESSVAGLTKAANTGRDGTSLEGLTRAARSLGLSAEGVQVDKDALLQVPTPAVAWLDGNHYVALLKIGRNAVTGSSSAVIHDPNEGVEKTIPLEELLSRSGGIVLTLKNIGKT